MPGDGERIDPARREVDRHLADRLHRVGVQGHAVLVRHLRQLADRLHGADLVVGPHDGDKGDVVRALMPAASTSGCTRPIVSTGSQVTSAPSCSTSH